VCDAWHSRRSNTILGTDLFVPDNMIPIMLRSSDSWGEISSFVHETTQKKEEEERRRQAAPNPPKTKNEVS